MSIIRARLREETRPEHESLEARVAIEGVSDRESYARYLTFLLAVHRPLERRLEEMPGFVEAWPFFSARRKSSWLAHDLGVLGVSEETVTDAAPLEALPIATIGAAFGAAYVLEGALLGGRVLQRRLSPLLENEKGADRYLRGYGEALSTRFGEFLEHLTAHEERHADGDLIVESARRTFRAIEQAYTTR